MTHKDDKLSSLRAAIGQQMAARPQSAPPPVKEPPATPTPKARREPRPKAGQGSGTPKKVTMEKTARSGKGVQFYLDNDDRKLINSLAVWFASQDRRVSDSQVIKILIRATRPNSALLEICDTVRQSDRRREKRS